MHNGKHLKYNKYVYLCVCSVSRLQWQTLSGPSLNLNQITAEITTWPRRNDTFLNIKHKKDVQSNRERTRLRPPEQPCRKGSTPAENNRTTLSHTLSISGMNSIIGVTREEEVKTENRGITAVLWTTGNLESVRWLLHVIVKSVENGNSNAQAISSHTELALFNSAIPKAMKKKIFTHLAFLSCAVFYD